MSNRKLPKWAKTEKKYQNAPKHRQIEIPNCEPAIIRLQIRQYMGRSPNIQQPETKYIKPQPKITSKEVKRKEKR